MLNHQSHPLLRIFEVLIYITKIILCYIKGPLIFILHHHKIILQAYISTCLLLYRSTCPWQVIQGMVIVGPGEVVIINLSSPSLMRNQTLP